MLPFIPLLLGHLMLQHEENVDAPFPESKWHSVMWATAGMMAIYMAGRAVGTAIGAHSDRVQQYYRNSQTKAFTRTVGVVFAIHLFCFGAGLRDVVSLYLLRFGMGILVGLLLRVASGSKEFDEKRLEHIVETGTAKVWLIGFAISMLTSGVLYNPLCHSELFTLLMGGGRFTLSWLLGPVTFVTIVQLTDLLLNCICGKFIVAVDYTYSQPENVNDIGQLFTRKEDPFVESSHGPSAVKRRNRLGSNGNRVRLGSRTTGRSRLGSCNSTNRPRLDSATRVRLGSNTSNDVFFDCESQCTNGSTTWDLDEELGSNSPPLISGNLDGKDYSFSVAKYENGKCVYDDGSPSPVQAELCVAHLPPAWKLMHKSKASEKWESTKRWRIENKVWKIHSTPHPRFPRIKDAYPHYIHGYSKLGYPIVYEKPGAMTLKKYFSEGTITVDDMMHHYRYFMEFLSNSLCSSPEVREMLDKRPESQNVSHWGFMVVMDVSGISLGVLSGDVLRYLQQAGKVNAEHYPYSTNMALLVNSPFWLSGAFGTIKSILPENTQADILSSSNQLEGMRKHIDDDQIPKEFGGSSPYTLGEHPFEKELEKAVEFGMKNTDDVDEEYLLGGPCELEHTMQEKTSFDIPEHLNNASFDLYEDREFDDVEIGNIPTSPLLSSNSNHTHTRIDISVRDEAPSCRHVISLRNGHKWKNARYYSEELIFVMISVIHCVWCAAQGSLETIVPLWLLSPQGFGGLGYEPRRSAFALFTASIVVMWLLRSKMAKGVGGIPANSPMRGYRIGVGAEAVLLLLLPFIPYISNFDSMLVLTTNALFFAAMFIASVIGRISSVKLHSIASSAYVEKISLRCDAGTVFGQCLNMVADFVQKGGLSYVLGVTGEMVGALIVTPIIVWSSQNDHHFPLDASFAFYTGSALCASLYMASFSFRIAGETPSRRVVDERMSAPSSCSIIRDIIAVSSQDMASMFEEQNWSSSAALRRQKSIGKNEVDANYNSKKI